MIVILAIVVISAKTKRDETNNLAFWKDALTLSQKISTESDSQPTLTDLKKSVSNFLLTNAIYSITFFVCTLNFKIPSNNTSFFC